MVTPLTEIVNSALGILLFDEPDSAFFNCWLNFSFCTPCFTTSMPFGWSTSISPRNWKLKKKFHHKTINFEALYLRLRLSKIFEEVNIRFASNFSNIKNTWFEHIQTLNFRIRFASIWTSNILNIFGKFFLAIISLFLSLFFWR